MPSSFDDFEIVRPLGSGGMGTVYVARERGLDRLVAIKFVANPGGDQHARERFAGEARALARLQHPNIVSLFRIGEVDGRPYLVCELVAGRRLDELSFPVAWPDALALGVGLARGVAAAHERGVIHRDIKPANVMIADDGVVKLLDFGLALFADGDVGAAAEVVGTPRYMAPELWAGAVATERSDLYALGLVLHELLLGVLPEERVRDLTEVPPSFARVVRDCVSRDPHERPASAAEVRDQLERVADALGRARPPAPFHSETAWRVPRELSDELATEDGLVTGRRQVTRRIRRSTGAARSAAFDRARAPAVHAP